MSIPTAGQPWPAISRTSPSGCAATSNARPSRSTDAPTRNRRPLAARRSARALPPPRQVIVAHGAVVRAGLVRHYAARHRLWQLDPDIAYLSGDQLPDGVRGFEVLDEIGFNEKRLRQALAAHDAGAAEILVRGIDVDPDALRKRLKLRGSTAVSVVITRIGSGTASRATSFICRPSR